MSSRVIPFSYTYNNSNRPFSSESCSCCHSLEYQKPKIRQNAILGLVFLRNPGLEIRFFPLHKLLINFNSHRHEFLVAFCRLYPKKPGFKNALTVFRGGFEVIRIYFLCTTWYITVRLCVLGYKRLRTKIINTFPRKMHFGLFCCY